VGPTRERKEVRDGRAVANATTTKERMGNNTTTTITVTTVSGAKGVTVDDGVVTPTATMARLVS
jgi:hypothetical protein